MKKIIPVLFIILVTIIFFWQFFIKGLLPIPADNVIGLYHPFRDLYAKDYPNGIPFKNFLITDPVRQQFPWRKLAISIEKRFELPLWNPYNFSGTPLLANMQSTALYPLNILFFILPFNLAWSILIILGPLLGGLFLYFYLDNLKINKLASLLGAISFSFSGFFVAWMEWGTIVHIALWLPLILLAIDKIFQYFKQLKISNKQIKNKKLFLWSVIFIFSLVSSFFAGHLQTFFYLYIFAFIYFLSRWFQYGKIFNILFVFLIFNVLFLILTSIQWFSTLQFILESARSIDIPHWQKEGWFRFIPWQHLIQFFAPDFFGNTSTLNYWGAWNYGEFIGYIGILPLIMAVFALFSRRDKKTLFYGVIFFLSLIFSFPTFFAKIPYILEIPFLSTTQPTRLLFITDFSLAVLAALGFDYFFRHKKTIVYPLIFIICIFVGLWFFVLFGNQITKIISLENIIVAKRNLVFPTLMFFISASLLFILIRLPKVHKRFTLMIYVIIVAIITFDLMRFGWKFTPFTPKEYLFPNTKVIEFLQKHAGNFRIMATDSRILPPNFSVIYRLQSIDGYDPLYLLRYGELIAASERGKADIDPPFGFNRIITPHNYNSKIIDLMGVKYILSLTDLKSDKLKKVFKEGETRIYENKNVSPRAFFVEQIKFTYSKKESINVMFDKYLDPEKTAIIEKYQGVLSSTPPRCTQCKAKISSYTENKVIIEVENNVENNDVGFLVLTDSFYPTWRAKIGEKDAKIYRTDYNFRGVFVPAGKQKVEFYNSLF